MSYDRVLDRVNWYRGQEVELKRLSLPSKKNRYLNLMHSVTGYCF